MNEDVKRRGRPPKNHLQEDHHFRTSDEVVIAGAPPVATEFDQADSVINPLGHIESAELITEGVTVISHGTGYTSEPSHPEPFRDESPIEQKIHQLVDKASLNGWHPIEYDTVLNSPPRNGIPVRLSESLENEGVTAFWKRERAFANATKRWQEHGVWRDFYTGMKIDFEPKYWKERYV